MEQEKKDNLVFILDGDIKFDYAEWPEGIYPLHYHDHYEFELVTSGKGRQLFNGEEFELSKNDIFLLRPVDYHQIISNENGFVDNMVITNISLITFVIILIGIVLICISLV